LNSRFAKVGVWCFYDNEVLNSSLVHLMKFSAEKSRLRKAAKRYPLKKMNKRILNIGRALLLSFILALAFTSCRKFSHYKYTGLVVGKGIDCGETFLIKSNQKINDVDNLDLTYYADQLPNDMKIDGLEIKFNCRVPTASELYPCTSLGAAYSHIVITEIEKK